MRKMHENEISKKIIGAAIEVHKILGPGLLEAVYEEALCHDMDTRNSQQKDENCFGIFEV